MSITRGFHLRILNVEKKNGKNKFCLEKQFTCKFWIPVAFGTGDSYPKVDCKRFVRAWIDKL